ncbi:TrlF family AAA-like ATPase [Peribacillus tepidiphilus]|uniref:TrlF family AAA-like ATPase n=1 Tax=Peribacillus tepidiphilus TaxID=2652445 RepID=UPI001291E1AB|nr:AAA family ATPase [Peribacillus tepidiphilus]
MKKFAEFYKCALQVNPYSYVAYRGEEHVITEDEYNQSILSNCLSEDIKVVGLADHGNVQTAEKLRKLLNENGIIVFPGFEIATAEKIHIVCLFSENTTPEQLNRYLGRLGLTDVENGVMPSHLSCLEIAKIIEEELKGFWYAAHITSDNGILKLGQMNHIWSDPRLKAAQIPYSLDEVHPRYINIIKNKEPMYKKETPFAFINAKDICKPEDILEKNAYCLVKMSEVNFTCFKEAFKDPSARVKLSYDQNERFHSSIDRIEVFGGYLDGLSIDLSRNLNTTIGGRGTGKSTLLELIRYALDLEPKSIESKKYFRELIKANLGLDNGRVELHVTSYQRYGQKYKIIKRFGDPTVVENGDGTVSNLSVKDILPHIEIYGQNEIIELVSNEEAKLNILNRFLPNQEDLITEREEIIKDLKQNAVKLVDKIQRKEEISNKISKLPKLEEKVSFFKETGIADKLSTIEHLSTEEEYIKKSLEIITQHNVQFLEVETPFTKEFMEGTPNGNKFEKIAEVIANFNLELNKLKDEYERLVKETARKVEDINTEWQEIKKESEGEIKNSIKSLEGFNGKTGPEIALEYRETVGEIARINPIKSESKRIEEELNTIIQERNSLLEKLKKNQDESYDSLRRAVKKINKGKLKGKVQVEVHAGKNRDELIEKLSEIEGLGPKSLTWIKEKDDFSLFSFIQHLNQGSDKLMEEYNLTRSKADILAQLSLEKKLELELVQLLDIIDVKLNTAGAGSEGENFKSLSKLSKGQQCTAILNILMLDNNDPLIIDQPEDNLDNSYIAKNFVDGLRDYKLNRQFIFATHNANIPVFGDAELIIVMEEVDGQGSIKENCIGSVDNQNVKTAVVNTLEGGDTAFKMRKAKYNI